MDNQRIKDVIKSNEDKTMFDKYIILCLPGFCQALGGKYSEEYISNTTIKQALDMVVKMKEVNKITREK